ncbi:MarR family winged helix-turn-helix transcriptional regulator [Williamsia sp. 1135]|uniref:MarR family winged helix-turn-helix transcriptional regulator n=1 Tax=Williamsia sp. 1135 TaxID=1889262 RepID=UPI000A106B07|nr:MarR family winged helix-turn-helix transcriptional regulator [Williamsia sp. 1135]ORM33874.1 MarR family transcriptional regulator [Williamsia sp. 1135]
MSDRRDDVWQVMASLVHSNRDTWRRAVIERSGLPFSRFRVLSRLDDGPRSVKALAAAATLDAPATTVAVNDLAERGLVDRKVDPGNRRTKIVSLTEAGRELLDSIRSIGDPAPSAFEVLSDEELSTLAELLEKLGQGSGRRTQRRELVGDA